MDCLVEGFLELFGEGFVYLCSAFVPNKNISERAHRIIGIVVLFVSLALFVGLIVGIFLLVETNGQSFWGWLLISLSVIYIVGGIALKTFSHMKKIVFDFMKSIKRQKLLKILAFSQIEVLKTAMIFALVPKWCPDFLW